MNTTTTDSSTNLTCVNTTAVLHAIHPLEVVIYTLLPLQLLAVVVNTIYVVCLIRGIRRNVLTQHLYYFLLSRGICDLLTSVVMLVGNAIFFPSSNRGHSETFSLIGTSVSFLLELTFFASMASTFALTWLKLLAVRYPLLYKTTVTKRHCIYAIIVSLLVGFAFYCSVVLTLWIKAGIISMEALCSADGSNCTHYLSIILGTICTAAYLSTILLFLFTMYCIYHPQQTENKILPRKVKIPCKLIASVAVFALFNAAEPPGQFLLGRILDSRIWISLTLQLHAVDCFTQKDIDDFTPIVPIGLGVWALMVALRMIVDPVVNYKVDSKLRLCTHKVMPMQRRNAIKQ